MLHVYNGLFPFVFLRVCSFSWGSIITILATDTHQTKMRKQKRKQRGNQHHRPVASKMGLPFCLEGNHVRGGGCIWQNIQYFSHIFIIFMTIFLFTTFEERGGLKKCMLCTLLTILHDSQDMPVTVQASMWLLSSMLVTVHSLIYDMASKKNV